MSYEGFSAAGMLVILVPTGYIVKFIAYTASMYSPRFRRSSRRALSIRSATRCTSSIPRSSSLGSRFVARQQLDRADAEHPLDEPLLERDVVDVDHFDPVGDPLQKPAW